MSFTGFTKSFTGPFQVLPGLSEFSRLYWVLQGFRVFYWVLLDIIVFTTGFE